MSLSRLHKFKLFAANRSLDHASAASNPSMSPTKSPVFHLQRRKTLRMLFEKSSDVSRRRNLRQILEESPELDGNSGKKKKRGNNRARRKLRELMVTSPSPPFSGGEEIDGGGEARGGVSSVTGGDVTSNGDGRELMNRRFGPSGPVQTFRLRILRKPWRPVLVSIPEQ